VSAIRVRVHRHFSPEGFILSGSQAWSCRANFENGFRDVPCLQIYHNSHVIRRVLAAAATSVRE
jgi:hypothetical protein